MNLDKMILGKTKMIFHLLFSGANMWTPGVCLLAMNFWSGKLTAQPLPKAWSVSSLRFDAGEGLPRLTGLEGIKWEKKGHLFTQLIRNGKDFSIVEQNPEFPDNEHLIARSKELIPQDSVSPLQVEDYNWYPEHNKLLVFSNSKRVWRARTRGDFWIFDRKDKSLFQLGATLPASSLQFAKLSPDGSKVAFVSRHNIYVQDLNTGGIRKLTEDGTEKIINGTFDWAYEEELFCRDGFRWSPDSKSIAYWQVNATRVRDYLMLNTTDSVYSHTIPVQYPKVGYDPSSARIGVIDLNTAQNKWLKIPGDPGKNYLVRMDWIAGSRDLIIQQLNRKQDTSRLFLVDPAKQRLKKIYEDTDSAWIDLNHFWEYDRPGWEWINEKSFVWLSEKDGWRHLYQRELNGKENRLLTKGNYDILDIAGMDREKDWIYFYASPEDATQRYLFKLNLNKPEIPVEVSPAKEAGTHEYVISPDGEYAIHSFSNHKTQPQKELLRMRDSKTLRAEAGSIPENLLKQMQRNPISFFSVNLDEKIAMDGWVIKPAGFDSTRKYPVLFYFYGEPASATVKDVFNPNWWYQDLADMGYVIVSIDNPGTPAPKGRAWRKAIFKKIGTGNIAYLAEATKKVLEWPWIDASRAAVWGWSGGGSSTQNLMFQYPDLFQTGIAVAGLSNLLFYDNIYEERYMGLLPEDLKYYEDGSSVNHVKGLKGNLLIIHGSGDDNVHYQNQEALINALVQAGKPFSMMEYPNRTHSISEGGGTTQHLYALMTDFLMKNCTPGAH